MKSKVFLGSVIGLCSCGTAISADNAGQIKDPAKPNILLIYTDDMGVGDLSCLNDGWVRTPNIDKLASQGLVMTNYYSAAPVSSPSRTGLTTGMFPAEWGIHTYLQWRKGNAKWDQCDYLDSSAPTMARTLKGGGYTTGHFGKWHMGGGRDVDNAPQITEYGFDEYVSTWESPDPDPQITGDPTWIWSNKDPVRRWDRTAYFIDKTLDFLERHKGEPCFVNLWPDDMHDPWVQDATVEDAEESWQTPVNFEAVLAEYDKQMGRLMAGLEELGIADNTIVIFTSDNGPAPSFKQVRTNKLRGLKCSLYEGGINMPFIVRWPDKIKPGIVDNKSVICSVDLLPTFCAITNTPLPTGYNLSGEDMSKALVGEPQVRTKDLMWEYGHNTNLDEPRPYHRSPHLGIRRGDMKLMVNAHNDTAELYNLSNDRYEKNNIADKHPELVKELRAKVVKWWDGRKRP